MSTIWTGTVTKATTKSRVGISFRGKGEGSSPVTIATLQGLFEDTDLVPGLRVQSINGISVVGLASAGVAGLIREAEAGPVTVVATGILASAAKNQPTDRVGISLRNIGPDDGDAIVIVRIAPDGLFSNHPKLRVGQRVTSINNCRCPANTPDAIQLIASASTVSLVAIDVNNDEEDEKESPEAEAEAEATSSGFTALIPTSPEYKSAKFAIPKDPTPQEEQADEPTPAPVQKDVEASEEEEEKEETEEENNLELTNTATKDDTMIHALTTASTPPARNFTQDSVFQGTVTKESKDTLTGISFHGKGTKDSPVVIAKSEGLFWFTRLSPGLKVLSVNGVAIQEGLSSADLAQWVREAEGSVTVEAQGTVATVTKRHREDKLGISLQNLAQHEGIFIAKIANKGLFFDHGRLAVGQKVTFVNGEPCPAKIADLMKHLADSMAVSLVTIDVNNTTKNNNNNNNKEAFVAAQTVTDDMTERSIPQTTEATKSTEPTTFKDTQPQTEEVDPTPKETDPKVPALSIDDADGEKENLDENPAMESSVPSTPSKDETKRSLAAPKSPISPAGSVQEPIFQGTVTKESKDTATGISFVGKGTKNSPVIIAKAEGLFHFTELCPGLKVNSINGVAVEGMSSAEVAQLVRREAAGSVTIVAQGTVSTVVKVHQEDKLGISLQNISKLDGIFVARITKKGLFSNRGLKVGQKVTVVNGELCPTKTMKLLHRLAESMAVTLVTIDVDEGGDDVLFHFTPPRRKKKKTVHSRSPLEPGGTVVVAKPMSISYVMDGQEYKHTGRFSGPLSAAGEMMGNGVFWFESGGMYMGEFREGQLHGVGCLCIEVDGAKSLFRGNFLYNEFVGQDGEELLVFEEKFESTAVDEEKVEKEIDFSTPIKKTRFLEDEEDVSSPPMKTKSLLSGQTAQGQVV
jgi:hypothetical protein